MFATGPSRRLTVNSAPVNSIVADTVDVSISNGVATLLGVRPQYVYGRDAISMLAELKSTRGKSIFVFGDSRSVQLGKYVAEKWTGIPLGGTSVTIPNYGNTGIWTQSLSVLTTSAAPTLGAAMGWVRSTAIAAVVPDTYDWANNNRMLLGYGDAPAFGQDFDLLNGCSLNAIFRKEPTGVVASNISLHAYVGGNNSLATTRRQSDFFSTYAATPTLQKVTLEFDATTDWVIGPSDYSFALDVAYRYNQTTTIGETVTLFDAAWVEKNDGTGATFHDCSLSGSTLGEFLDNTIVIPADLATFLALRATKTPWLILDKGSNATPGGVATKDWHIHQLRRSIAKFRVAVGDPAARVLLRTSYQESTNSSTVYYQLAAIEVAQQDPNVMCVDTFGASVAGGGYATAVTKGWMGDTVHRNAAGRAALETMFAAIISGNAWSYSSTLG